VIVDVVIPALDEERALPGLFDELRGAAIRRVIVADNGSRDRTREVARERGALVVDEPHRGYGAACLRALAECRIDPPEIVVFMDADGSDDPAELPALLRPLLRGEADLVIGTRLFVERGALTPQQRFGNWLATRLISLLYHHRYTDLGPFRAIRRDLLDRIGMRDRRYGWTVEMQIRALQLGARVVEVPVHYRRRVGRSKISGTVTGVIKAGWWIVYTIFKYR
jgi:glycosyltransferase involved in cell wall biosynthesis